MARRDCDSGQKPLGWPRVGVGGDAHVSSDRRPSSRHPQGHSGTMVDKAAHCARLRLLSLGVPVLGAASDLTPPAAPLRPRHYLADMPEANYLVGHPDGPYYRLIMRHFHERHREHAHYVRSDEIVARVRETFPEYDEASCRRHMDQLQEWRLVRVLPEQSRPATLLELRNRPRTYQAERVALQFEDLRRRLEAESGAATLNPTALEQLVRRLEELATWVAEGHVPGVPEDEPQTFERWRAAHAAFDAFARGVEDYLGDLPRHRPREALDYLGFLGYRDVLTRYLYGYAHRLFDRREYARHLLLTVRPAADAIAQVIGREGARHVRADGTTPDEAAEREEARREVEALYAYFAHGGDVDVLLDRAQGWVAEITRHARRLSEQNSGGTVRAGLLLELARRFVSCSDLPAAERLAQVAFGLTLPLHWKGVAPEPRDGSPWVGPPVVVPLQAVRRGRRPRLPDQATADRTVEELALMLEEREERRRSALALARLFGLDGRLAFDGLRLDAGADRQRLLRLLYRALAQDGRTAVGYRDWSVIVETPTQRELGALAAPDGELILPRFRLRLDRGRDARGAAHA